MEMEQYMEVIQTSFIYLFINFSRQQKYKHIQTGRRFRNTNTA